MSQADTEVLTAYGLRLDVTSSCYANKPTTGSANILGNVCLVYVNIGKHGTHFRSFLWENTCFWNFFKKRNLKLASFHFMQLTKVLCEVNHSETQPRSQGLSLPALQSERRETLVGSGHVPPRIWGVTKESLMGGAA